MKKIYLTKEKEKYFIKFNVFSLSNLMSKQQDKKMEESKFKDVELISDGVTIPCHKLILALHSQYFRTLFSKPQLDSNQLKLCPSVRRRLMQSKHLSILVMSK